MVFWRCTRTFGLSAVSAAFFLAACGDPATTLAETPATSSVSGLSKAEIEKIVHEYIVSNPEVIVEAFDELERREVAKKTELFEKNLVSSTDELWNDGFSYVAGNPKGDITIVEFYDYNCGYCRRVLPTVQRLIDQDKNIRVVFKEWPIQGPESVVAARASMAANKQGKFMELHQALMNAPEKVTEEYVMKTAAQVGIDVVQLQKDMKAPEMDEMLSRNGNLAQTLGITGTPAFVVGDQLIPGAAPLEQFQAAIVEARANCKIC